MLLTGSKVDSWQKTATILNFTHSPPNFHSSWKKLSHVSKDCSAIVMHGLALINWTTWEWKNIVTQSFSCVMHTLAATAIAESATIMLYQHEMILCHPYGGAMTFCLQVRLAVTPFFLEKDPGQTSILHQMTLKDMFGSSSQDSKQCQSTLLTKGDLPPPYSLTWPDGIYPTLPDEGICLHIIKHKLFQLDCDKALGAQQHKVQMAVNGVQNLCVTLHDLMSRANTHDKPLLDADVKAALHSLVMVDHCL